MDKRTWTDFNFLLVTEAYFHQTNSGTHSQCGSQQAHDHKEKKETFSIIMLPDSHRDTQAHIGPLLTQSLTGVHSMKDSNCYIVKIHCFISFLC